MKKTFILLTLVSFISATAFINSPGTASTQAAIKTQVAYGGVPEEVQLSFDGIVTDVINNWYPSNSGWDASGVTWERDRGNWVATGDVTLIGGGGGINVVDSHFKNTGEFISLNYNVLP